MKKLLKIVLAVMALIFTPLIVNAQDENGNWEICIECGGSGHIIVGEWDGDYYVENEVPCPVCGGAGYIGDKPATTETQPKDNESITEDTQPEKE